MRKTASSSQLPASSRTGSFDHLRETRAAFAESSRASLRLGLAVACSIASAPVGSQARRRLPEIKAPVLFDTPEADRILDPADPPARQPLARGHHRSARARDVGGDRQVDWRGRAARLQPGHELRHRAGEPADGERADHRVPRRVRSRARSPFRRTRRSRTGRLRATRTPRRCRVRGPRSSSFSAKAPAIVT